MRSIFLIVSFVLVSGLALGFDVQTEELANKVSVSIEIPEVQELVFIVFALTKSGLTDSLMINHSSSYYAEVLEYFAAFKEENIVKDFDRVIDKSYSQLRMDACNYGFDDNNSLVKSKDYHNLSWGKRDYLKKYLPDLIEFSEKSMFRNFYASHQDYYNELVRKLDQQTDVAEQHRWLESNFPIHREQYRIIFSPLSYGMHCTNGQLADVVVWVSGPLDTLGISQISSRAGDSRMVFTEIDHNYVNPVSDLYLKEIKKAFNQRDVWACGKYTDAYRSPYALFNEYMTWAVFILYAKEKYSNNDFLVIKRNVEITMTDYRGFCNFKWFSDALLESYINRMPESPVSDLYLPMLELCEEKQK